MENQQETRTLLKGSWNSLKIHRFDFWKWYVWKRNLFRTLKALNEKYDTFLNSFRDEENTDLL